MTLLYEFKIVQEYEDQAPEDFGFQFFGLIPKVGDIIQLYWLDKRPAYKLKVTAVDPAKLEIRGHSVAN